MKTPTTEQESYIGEVVMKENNGNLHPVDQTFLRDLVNMELPAEIKGSTDQTNVLDYIFENKDYVNGEIGTLLKKHGKPSRDAYVKEMLPKIEEKRKAAVVKPSSQPVVQAAAPAAVPTDDSREKRMLLNAMRIEVYNMLGITEANNTGTLKEEVQKHFEKKLTKTAKVLFALSEDIAVDIHGKITEYSIRDAFGALLGPIASSKKDTTDKPSREEVAYSKLLGIWYEKVLLHKLPTSDKKPHEVFKDRAITSLATQLAKLSGDPVEDEKARLEPIYPSTTEDLKKEIFSTTD